MFAVSIELTCTWPVAFNVAYFCVILFRCVKLKCSACKLYLPGPYDAAHSVPMTSSLRGYHVGCFLHVPWDRNLVITCNICCYSTVYCTCACVFAFGTEQKLLRFWCMSQNKQKQMRRTVFNLVSKITASLVWRQQRRSWPDATVRDIRSSSLTLTQ